MVAPRHTHCTNDICANHNSNCQICNGKLGEFSCIECDEGEEDEYDGPLDEDGWPLLDEHGENY